VRAASLVANARARTRHTHWAQAVFGIDYVRNLDPQHLVFADGEFRLLDDGEAHAWFGVD